MGFSSKFFSDTVLLAFARHRILASPSATLYGADVLDRHLTAVALRSASERSYAEQLLEARQQGPSAQAVEARRVGDECLVVAGFFPPSNPRRLVDAGYYADVGVTAYGTAATVLRSRTPAMATLLEELMHRFHSIAVALRGVEARVY